MRKARPLTVPMRLARHYDISRDRVVYRLDMLVVDPLRQWHVDLRVRGGAGLNAHNAALVRAVGQLLRKWRAGGCRRVVPLRMIAGAECRMLDVPV